MLTIAAWIAELLGVALTGGIGTGLLRDA